MSLHPFMRLGIACPRDRAQTICASSLVRVSAQREFNKLCSSQLRVSRRSWSLGPLTYQGEIPIWIGMLRAR